MQKSLVDRLVKSRLRGPLAVHNALKAPPKSRSANSGAIASRHVKRALDGSWRQPTHLRGRYNGSFVKVPLPPSPDKVPLPLKVPKLPTLLSPTPKPFVKSGMSPVEAASSSRSSSANGTSTAPAVAASLVTHGHGLAHSHLTGAVSNQAHHSSTAATAAALSALAKQEGVTTSLRILTFIKRLSAWFRSNWAILFLNFGSVCTLVGFTRSDMLELRALSMMGSASSVIYVFASTKPTLWPSIAWSLIFASVNGFKIYNILQERNADVHMTTAQQTIFVQHFMPHGITPKQFERIYKKATIMRLKQGSYLIRKGEPLEHIYLVVEGATRAHVLGRQLSAISTTPQTKGNQKIGGDSGAWVGEIAFLDRKEQDVKADQAHHQMHLSQLPTNTPAVATPEKQNSLMPVVLSTTQPTTGPTVLSGPSETMHIPKGAPRIDAFQADATKREETTSLHPLPPEQLLIPQPGRQALTRAMYTIVAASKEDTVVLRWSFNEMAELMDSSTDMRAALTRAMTSALVGKVVNLTVSRTNSQHNVTWMKWLGDWKNNAGAQVTVQEFHPKHQAPPVSAPAAMNGAAPSSDEVELKDDNSKTALMVSALGS